MTLDMTPKIGIRQPHQTANGVEYATKERPWIQWGVDSEGLIHIYAECLTLERFKELSKHILDQNEE